MARPWTSFERSVDEREPGSVGVPRPCSLARAHRRCVPKARVASSATARERRPGSVGRSGFDGGRSDLERRRGDRVAARGAACGVRSRRPRERAPGAHPPATGRAWLSADEVAPLLRTTAHSLRRLAREGRSPVPAHRIGGRWWFARAEVERFIGMVDHDRRDRY
ncbi:MAG: helix-turn-helix domain-containing protein [Thermoleophilaceae bacterium]